MNNYLTATDAVALAAEFPIGHAFVDRFRSISRDALRAEQEARFQRVLSFAWKTPFYRRLWGARGIEPGDIKSLDDLAKLPTFDKSDIMDSITRHPPFGDFHGMETYAPVDRPPVILHTTSGTTGKPQVLLFGPRGREVQNLLLARAYLFQGLRDDDIVHSVYGHGMVNGGHYIREVFTHWTRAIFMPAGTGIETRSQTQVEMMRDFGSTVIVGFGDYIKHLGQVAHDAGLACGRDLKIRMISGHVGEDRNAVRDAWGGAEVFDWYGVGDTGIIAGEGPDHAGLYVMEDAQYLELLDIESANPVAEGEVGDMVVTVLFKDDIYPMIRFNTHDVTAFRTDTSPLGLNLRRIRGFLGRSDNMVKLRGINVFPQAIAAILAERADFAGDYVCKVRRDGSGRDTMTVAIEVKAPNASSAEYRELLRRRLGVEVAVEFAVPGALAAVTGIESRQKPIRLIDERGRVKGEG
ncbi:MAG: phenylacetate--CoA ligase family protein [Burkholderiales bacterium]